MDATRFGCFVADQRKKQGMTQKDLAAKIQVTDKAVSKWERGLGFPDINTIEDLADALGVSIEELMKSERQKADAVDEEVMPKEELSPAAEVVALAKVDMAEQQKTLCIIALVTTVLCTIAEILGHMQWDAEKLQLSADIPYTAIVPGVTILVYSLVRRLQGKKTNQLWALGLSLLLIPVVLFCGAFLFYALFFSK